MKYMIKCGYCDKTFVVDTDTKDADFLCDSCGGKNDKSNIVREIVPQKKVVYRSANRAEENAWKAIKEFDLSEYEGKGDVEEPTDETLYDIVSGASTSRKAWLFHMWPILLFYAICIGYSIYHWIFK